MSIFCVQHTVAGNSMDKCFYPAQENADSYSWYLLRQEF